MALFSLTPENLNLLAEHKLWFDAGVRLHPPLKFAPPVRLFPCTLSSGTQIDSFSYVAPNTGLHNVHVGRYCSIGDNVSILSNHPTDRLSTHPFTYENIFGAPFQSSVDALVPFDKKLPTTTIGHDVWIGAGVRIRSGVTIGNGCIVGAGSVVTKDIPDYSVVGGVPAKLIRRRFSDAQIARLQRLQWWQYNLIGIKLNWEDIDACCDSIEQLVATGALVPYTPRWIVIQ